MPIKQYRMLREGETIQEADEWRFHLGAEEWFFAEDCIGCKVTAKSVGLVRRPTIRAASSGKEI